MRRKAMLTAAMAIALTACGGGSDGPTTPKTSNVSGSWAYTATGLTGAGLTCSVSSVTLTLGQSGTTVSGSYSGGTLNCGSAGVAQFAGGAIASGTVNGTSVAFNFDDPSYHHTGTVSGNAISGTAVIQTNSGTLTGSFTATKL